MLYELENKYLLRKEFLEMERILLFSLLSTESELASEFKNDRSYCEVQNFWLRLLLFTMVRWTMQENAMQLQETLNDKKNSLEKK